MYINHNLIWQPTKEEHTILEFRYSIITKTDNGFFL